MTKLHLCIVTGQPLANFIPLLQEKPAMIYLLHSNDPKMTDAAQQFVSSLQAAGFDRKQIHVKDGLPTSPYDRIREYAMGIEDDIDTKFPASDVTWNTTGGTKMMALAFWDALDHDKRRVIYVETQGGIMEQLLPKSDTIPLQSLLTPALYLTAVGKIKRSSASDDPQWQELTNARKTATFHLINQIGELQELFQQFNCQLDSNNKQLQTLKFGRIGKSWQAALDRLVDADLITPARNNEYHTTRTHSAKYLTGGWLEEYVWLTARQENVDHVEAGLKFGDLRLRKQGQDNEIDAFILHQNRSLIVECKTGYMGKDEQKDSNIVYKLDSVGDQAGGNQATRLLVSAQELQHDTKQGRHVNTRARALAADIRTLETGELKNLGENIRYWKDHGQWPMNI